MDKVYCEFVQLLISPKASQFHDSVVIDCSAKRLLILFVPHLTRTPTFPNKQVIIKANYLLRRQYEQKSRIETNKQKWNNERLIWVLVLTNCNIFYVETCCLPTAILYVAVIVDITFMNSDFCSYQLKSIASTKVPFFPLLTPKNRCHKYTPALFARHNKQYNAIFPLVAIGCQIVSLCFFVFLCVYLCTDCETGTMPEAFQYERNAFLFTQFFVYLFPHDCILYLRHASS